MKVLEIYLSNKTKKFLKKVDKLTFERVFNKIKELALDPYPSDAKRVIGRKATVIIYVNIDTIKDTCETGHFL